MIKQLFSAAGLLLLLSCSQSRQLQSTSSNTASSEKGLKDYYADYFTMGVAVSPRALKTDEAGLVLQQFNSLTPVNAMKTIRRRGFCSLVASFWAISKSAAVPEALSSAPL